MPVRAVLIHGEGRLSVQPLSVTGYQVQQEKAAGAQQAPPCFGKNVALPFIRVSRFLLDLRFFKP
jgi:hypothetical protein